MELPTPQELKDRRESLGLTQSTLAEMADVSQPLIARIEGDDVDPRLSTLRRIVNALNEAEGEVVRAADVMNENVVYVSPDDSVRGARDRMLAEGFSQLPVIRDGRPQGFISNSDIRHVHEDNVADLPVAEAMRESFTTVEPDATIDEVDSYLDRHDAVLVMKDGTTVGIITDADIAAQIP
jgi:predicted transcriptional regulator